MLRAGMYRGRVGDRGYFSGLSSVYAGDGPYGGYAHNTGGPMAGRQVRHAAMARALTAAQMHMGGVRLGSVISFPHSDQRRRRIGPNFGASFLTQVRNATDQSLPPGIMLGGVHLGAPPLRPMHLRVGNRRIRFW